VSLRREACQLVNAVCLSTLGLQVAKLASSARGHIRRRLNERALVLGGPGEVDQNGRLGLVNSENAHKIVGLGASFVLERGLHRGVQAGRHLHTCDAHASEQKRSEAEFLTQTDAGTVANEGRC
jgi:hypothetical protein